MNLIWEKENLPVLPAKIICRKNVLELFQQKSVKKIIYVNAPIGYGKTTITLLWAQEQKKKCIWITCNRFNNHPNNFYYGVMHALQAHKHTEQGSRLLVLDDFHSITNGKIYDLVIEISKYLPECFHIIILSRQRAKEKLYQYILGQIMEIIDMDDLKLSPEDITELFLQHEIILEKEDCERILTVSNGNIMAVNGFILQSKGAYSWDFLRTCMEESLKAHIWDESDNQIRKFMLTAFTLEEIDIGLYQVLFPDLDIGQIMDELYMKNGILIQQNQKGYVLSENMNHLLGRMASECPQAEKNTICEQAAAYYIYKKNMEKAILIYLKSESYDKIDALIRQDNLKWWRNSIARVVNVIEKLGLEDMEDMKDITLVNYPYFFSIFILFLYVTGKKERFLTQLDNLYKELNTLLKKDSYFISSGLSVAGLDFRKRMEEVYQENEKYYKSRRILSGIYAPSFHLPFFHRSGRDYADDFLKDEMYPDSKTFYMRILGEEYPLIANCLAAGIQYERSLLAEALEAAVLANAFLKEQFPSDLKFCAKIILATILREMGKEHEAKKIEESIEQLIEKSHTRYLKENYIAYQYQLKIKKGDMIAAGRWLKRHHVQQEEPIVLYKLYQIFTTAKALILNEEYHVALLCLSGLNNFAAGYYRTLDRIEINILTALSWWKAGRHEQAIQAIKAAIDLAFPGQFVRLFLNEAPSIKMVLRKYFAKVKKNGTVDVEYLHFIQKLVFSVDEICKKNQSSKVGADAVHIKLSRQQRAVMRLLSKGFSYAEMADELGLRLTTIKTHISGAYLKLNVSNASEAISKIKEYGILDPENLS